jgi:hypothetical protein
MKTFYILVAFILLQMALHQAFADPLSTKPLQQAVDPRQAWETASYKPPAGYIPDSTTAEKVALAVLAPAFGKNVRLGPVVLQSGKWRIQCTVPAKSFEICICKLSGRIVQNELLRRHMVADSETAKSIAEAVWLPIYGKNQLDTERPFQAKKLNGFWRVEGTMPLGKHGVPLCGGVAEAEISETDGLIRRVIHGE